MRKIISISLLLIFLVSQFNIAFGTHYCGGSPVKSQLMFSKAHLDCGMEVASDCSDMDNEAVFDQGSCCENVYIQSNTDQAFQQSNLTVNYLQYFLPVLWFSFQFKLIDTYALGIPITGNKLPPLIRQEINILYQTFLL